jgi:hypothetical protein
MKNQIGFLGSFLLGVAIATVGLSGEAQAISFTATSGSRAASADFTVSGDELTVVLTNTSSADVLVPVDVLTAVFFSPNGPIFASSTAVLTAGSTVFFDSAPAGGVVGGEWAYGSGLVGAPLGATQGISSAGFGLFGGATFPGVDLDPPAAIDGLNYGITSAGDNPGTGNAPVTGGVPLIQNSVTFKFSGATGFDLTSITNVSFQYGTALTEPNISSVPEPASLMLLGAGLAGIGIWRQKSTR